MQFDVTFTRTEHAPTRNVTDRFDGAMIGVMAFSLEPQSDVTNVYLQVDFEISTCLLGRIVNKLLFTQVAEKNAERILENLAIAAEAG